MTTKLTNLRDYLILPKEITPFESTFLSRLNKIALAFFYLHIPILIVVAWAAGTGPLYALELSLAVLAGPTVAFRVLSNPRQVSIVYGITAMLVGGLLVHFGQGPVQIEMHFYFFALLPMLCLFANPLVNLAAAITVALHHLLVWLFLPSSVFNYQAEWWVVLVHASFVVLETVAACYISRQFFDNVVGLEKIVLQRTETIRHQQRDMALILNNLQEGLVTIDLRGRMSSESSRVMREWFGAAPPDQSLVSWIGGLDRAFAEWLELGLETVREAMLPPAVALAQLPSTLHQGERTYAVGYQGIANEIDENAPDKLLVIFNDVTEAMAHAAAEQKQNDLLQMFGHMMRDRNGFLEFLVEAQETVDAIHLGKYDSITHLKRLLHTLKGNSAIFGMSRVSGLCHTLENFIAETDCAPERDEVEKLLNIWTETRADLDSLMGTSRERRIELDNNEYHAILEALRSSVDMRSLSRMIESLPLEPINRRLEIVKQQLLGLAERLGKSVRVLVEPSQLRLNSSFFAPFWSAFVHVLRNTVDHGVEDVETRQRAGKPQNGVIRVSTAIDEDRSVLAVEDDGPGVDWDGLRAKAAKLGKVIPESADNVKLLCMADVSSRDTASETSGRGIGMSSVLEACERLGGRMEVISKRGVGTRLRFLFPKDPGVYEGHAAVLQSTRPSIGE